MYRLVGPERDPIPPFVWLHVEVEHDIIFGPVDMVMNQSFDHQNLQQQKRRRRHENQDNQAARHMDPGVKDTAWMTIKPSVFQYVRALQNKICQKMLNRKKAKQR